MGAQREQSETIGQFQSATPEADFTSSGATRTASQAHEYKQQEAEEPCDLRDLGGMGIDRRLIQSPAKDFLSDSVSELSRSDPLRSVGTSIGIEYLIGRWSRDFWFCERGLVRHEGVMIYECLCVFLEVSVCSWKALPVKVSDCEGGLNTSAWMLRGHTTRAPQLVGVLLSLWGSLERGGSLELMMDGHIRPDACRK
ncbi:unnamed protein product [Boreogadus saida]